MRAWLGLRHGDIRQEIFTAGFKALGYKVENRLTTEPKPDDVLCIWNRFGQNEQIAKHFNHVLVAENAAWGNDFAGDKWYSIGRNFNNVQSRFGPPDRWDSLNVKLCDWRQGSEVVILPQRGLGAKGVAMPQGWPQEALKRYGGRIRQHPGKNPCKPLEEDLANCSKVVTWGSGAAIKALMWGIPVVSEMPRWIGEQENTDAGRLEMFRRLSWQQWRHSEISSGEALKWLLR